MNQKLVEIKEAKKVVFVGDTHGDLEASQKVIKNYLKEGNKIVFLGDYVDRGPSSIQNLNFLLETRAKNSDKVYLLQGNHEGHRILKFQPAEFWENLNPDEYEKYCSIVEKFPLVAIAKDIIALHGVLPKISSTRPGNVDEVNKIKLGDDNWFKICWGDFYDEAGEDLGVDIFSGRPQFGRDYFFKLMERFNKKVLIRSHQPDVLQFMFDDRCLTIFTSSAYTRERTIAIADLEKPIETAKDLKIIKI